MVVHWHEAVATGTGNGGQTSLLHYSFNREISPTARETSPMSDQRSEESFEDFVMRMPTLSRTEGILRVVPPASVLKRFGEVFGNNESWKQVAWKDTTHESPRHPILRPMLSSSNIDLHAEADKVFQTSKPASRVGTFISHVWASRRWRKHLALCYCLNINAAVICATTTWLCLILWSIWHWGIFGMGGKTFLIPLFVWIPTAVFFMTIFFGHLLFGAPEDWWLDKLCIHQSREKLKEQGVNALPEIVATADKMIILWDKQYFERLWCCAEVAIFCSTKRGASCVEFAPLWLAPWVLSTILTQLLCISIAERLFSLIGYVGAYLATVEIVPPGLVPLLAQFCGVGIGFWLGSLPAVPLSYYAMNAKMHNYSTTRKALRHFDIHETKCAVESDREQVERLVTKLYRDYDEPLHAFNSFVRKDLSKYVEQKVIGESVYHIRYRLCLLMFLPIAFSSVANVLGCDGIECNEAAVEELGPGAIPPVQMGNNCCAWLVGCFLIYPTSYPVMLKLMILAEKTVGKKAGKWTLLCIKVLAIIVAYAYMGFTEGFAAGLLNSTNARIWHLGFAASLPWVIAVCIFMALLIAWNVHLYRSV